LAKRGPKGKDNKTKENQGTYQPCRERKEYYSAVGDNNNLVCPDWLVDRFGEKIKKFWDWKIKVYNLREQSVAGMEDQFAMLCAMHGQIVEFYDNHESPPVSLLQAYRLQGNEFHDTPASNKMPIVKKNGNPFAKHGIKVVK
jgi:hypothetical protein